MSAETENIADGQRNPWSRRRMFPERSKEMTVAEVQLEIQERENERLRSLLADLKSEFALYRWKEDHKQHHKDKLSEFPFFQKLFSKEEDCSVQIPNLKKSVLDSRMIISKQVNEIAQLKREIMLYQNIIQQLLTCMNQTVTELVAEAVPQYVLVNKVVPKDLKDLNSVQTLANDQCELLRKAKVNMLDAAQENVADAKRHIANYIMKKQDTTRTERLKFEQEIRDYEKSQKVQSQILLNVQCDLETERRRNEKLKKEVVLLQSCKNNQIDDNEKSLEEQVQILRTLHESVRGNENIYKLADLVGFTVNSESSVGLAPNRPSKEDKWEVLKKAISLQSGILKCLQSLVIAALNYSAIQTNSNQDLKNKLKKLEDDTMAKQQKHSKDLKIYQGKLTQAQQRLASELRGKQKQLTSPTVQDRLLSIKATTKGKQLDLIETEHDGQGEMDGQLGRQTEKINLLKTQLKEEREFRIVADGKLFLLEESFRSLKHFCENELKHRLQFLQYFNQLQKDKCKTNNSVTPSGEKGQLESDGRAKKALELELDIKTNEIVVLKQNLKQMENQLYRNAFDERFKEERNNMAKLHEDFMKALNEFHETSEDL